MEKLIHYHLLVVLEGRNIPKTSLVSQSDQFFTDNHNPYDSVKNYKRRAEIENVVKIRSVLTNLGSFAQQNKSFNGQEWNTGHLKKIKSRWYNGRSSTVYHVVFNQSEPNVTFLFLMLTTLLFFPDYVKILEYKNTKESKKGGLKGYYASVGSKDVMSWHKIETQLGKYLFSHRSL